MSESSTLQLNNRDNRDNNIRFYAKGHKYEILTDIKSKYTNINFIEVPDKNTLDKINFNVN